MAGITKKQISARRQRLLEELPNHGWDYVQAGIAAGYSPSYAKARLKKYVMKDSTFCQQVTVKRHEIEVKTEDRREKRLQQLDAMIDNPATKDNIRLKAIDLQGKMCGWHSETRVLETGFRQRELSEIEREEARKLALLRFNALPGEIVETHLPSDVYENEETMGKKIVNSVDTTPEQPQESFLDGQ